LRFVNFSAFWATEDNILSACITVGTPYSMPWTKWGFKPHSPQVALPLTARLSLKCISIYRPRGSETA